MCRRPLAGFFSRMCTGTPMASPNCPAAAQTRQCVWMSLLQEGLACCLCPVSGCTASESACSFLFLQPSVHSFCTPSVHLLYTFCTPSVHLLYTFCTFCTFCTPLQVWSYPSDSYCICDFYISRRCTTTNKQKTTPSGHACCPTPAVPPYRSCRRQSCCALPRLPHDKLLFLPLSGSLLTSTSRFVQPSPSQRLVALLPWSIETYDRQTSLAGWCSSREPYEQRIQL